MPALPGTSLLVLDTNTVIDILRLRNNVAQRLAQQSPEQMALTSMTLAELQFGVLINSNPNRAQIEVDKIVKLSTVLSFGRKAAMIHARLRRELRDKPIGSQDMVIAATVLANDATLITSNTREFCRVPGLRIENWRSN